ncbi:MAG: PIG-L family deacetylase [Bryobacteraceae bacterium]|nr:PIG-L family deacetylase [Bryobacteraceae bacterium]
MDNHSVKGRRLWSRRQAVNLTLLGATGGSLSRGAQESAGRKWKVLVAGAHPDDPETGCGGTICRYTAAGHDVAVLYLTRGEAGVRGASHKDAARIRTEEAKQACAALKARALFAGQIDGATEITARRYGEMLEIVRAEDPDVIFTHWPVDTHRDHRICSNLIFDAWLSGSRRAALYYYEVARGFQTQTFSPTDWVNIDAVIEQKWKACFLHKSQGITRERYDQDHGRMELFRGLEARCRYAEAFVRQMPGPGGMLP